VFISQIGPGDDKAVIIERQAASQPLSVWAGPGHQEQMAIWTLASLARLIVAENYALEMFATLELDNLRVRIQSDVGRFLNPPDEVP
jgi:hypothetical protein